MGIRIKKHSVRFIFLILILPLLWLMSRSVRLDISAAQGFLSGLPISLSAPLYVISYVIVTFFVFFSKDLFWFMGAFLFGPFFSALLICIAEIINAFILFKLARFLGRQYVEKRMSAKYRNLDERLKDLNFFWLFIFRAAPLIPYRFMDLAGGLTAMSFKRYLLAVVLGTPVKMFWIQYIIFSVGLSIFNDPAYMMEYFLANKTMLFFGFFYLLLALLAVVKIARRLN